MRADRLEEVILKERFTIRFARAMCRDVSRPDKDKVRWFHVEVTQKDLPQLSRKAPMTRISVARCKFFLKARPGLRRAEPRPRSPSLCYSSTGAGAPLPSTHTQTSIDDSASDAVRLSRQGIASLWPTRTHFAERKRSVIAFSAEDCCPSTLVGGVGLVSMKLEVQHIFGSRDSSLTQTLGLKFEGNHANAAVMYSMRASLRATFTECRKSVSADSLDTSLVFAVSTICRMLTTIFSSSIHANATGDSPVLASCVGSSRFEHRAPHA